MFSWFNKWFANKCRQAWKEASWNIEVEDDKYAINTKTASVGLSRGRILDQRGMNFTIYPANGGYVMEYSKYDERTDRHNQTLHIIPSEQELGQGIAHVITYEMLKN
jgi:hypothetical protein